MLVRFAAALLACALCLSGADPTPPRAGKVEILPSKDVKPGMKAIAWTVFEGDTPEAVPIDIVGTWTNMMGPGQDIIIGKMGGKAERTNVAGGMSGSPVYIDGKLIGAVALRLSTFSPDAICGITPIELMLEINQFDKTRPTGAQTPDKLARASTIPQGLSQVLSAQNFEPIATPLVFSGFNSDVLRNFAPEFDQMGVTAVQGGAAAALVSTKPAADWKTSLQPGQSIAGVLVSGDMSVTGLGTVTYNDGSRVLAFGHPFFNIGPIDMPMSKGNVLMVLASTYQPNKIANATEVVGALHQDRHSGIMGVLGDEAPMIPVTIDVRSIDGKKTVQAEKKYHFNVFQQEKWTPQLMGMTLLNAVSAINETADEATYRLNATVDFMDGHTPLTLTNMQSTADLPLPPTNMLAAWWGDKFNRLYGNAVKMPELSDVNVTVDLLPERRVATIENAWTPDQDAHPGDEIPIKVFLRPYHGERIERDFSLKLPAGITKGDHRIVLSDAENANRMQALAVTSNHYMDVSQLVSLLNQERSNNNLYVSLVDVNPTAYFEDKMLPSLPSSVMNVMQAGKTMTQAMVMSPESAREQMSLPFDYVVNGSYTLHVTVK